MLSVRLPKEIDSKLVKLAKLTGRTKSSIARNAIIEHIADLEDLYLSEKRLVKNLKGESKTFSLAFIETQLGLAN
jgi:RHH-type transcriptional regulator, rel operon repressor / antitoxin RelB